MKANLAILILAISSVAFAGILTVDYSAAEILQHTPNPNDIFRQVVFSPLNYCGKFVLMKTLWSS